MPLSLEEYERYGRQMLLPSVGRRGQEDLKSSRCLIVGCGGLGCPCIAYLAGAGVGVLGLCDGDTVDVSNLPRQILHTTPDADAAPEYKVHSAQRFVQQRNPNVRVVPIAEHLTASSALRIFCDTPSEPDESRPQRDTSDVPACAWDLVVDCTDTQPLRYLLSDLCVVFGVPLVSGSALKLDGQLSIYNDYLDVEPDFSDSKTLAARSAGSDAALDTDLASGTNAGDVVSERGPCYRCIFPKPTPAEATQSCGEAGVLGPVVGAIGVLEALESIKLLLRLGRARRRTSSNDGTTRHESTRAATTRERKRPTMHVFSAMSETPWRTIRLRGRRLDCIACGAEPRIGIDVFRRAANFQPVTHRGASDEDDADSEARTTAMEALSQYEALCHPPPTQLEAQEAADDRLSASELAASFARRESTVADALAGCADGDDGVARTGNDAGEAGEKPSVHDIEHILRQSDTVVLDVRSEVEFDICHLSGSLSVPLDRLPALLSPARPPDADEPFSTTATQLRTALEQRRPILVVCRHGHDSLIGARLLRRFLPDALDSTDRHESTGSDSNDKHSRSRVQDLRGGLDALARCTTDFPRY